MVTTSGANVLVSGTQVGTFTFSGGQLDVTFNASATQARVNTLMQNIVYWNNSDTPPASVQLNWSFNDGNAGAQGSGGALQATGSTTINITAVDDHLAVVDTTGDVTDGDTSSLNALYVNRGADGKISLREAIIAANNTASADTINFQILDALLGGAHTINLLAALPTITSAVIIDASTDADFALNGNRPVVVLDGNNLAADGLVLGNTADGSTIRGLIIRFSGHAIWAMTGSDGNTIAGNYIGSLTTGRRGGT